MIFSTFSKEVSPYGFFSKFKNAIQIRLAHKKVAGSKTHMQDSPGRRLGPKKHEGEAVKVGQIILRQRGTKWYPGVNVGIGRDHTLFASEPGFVRFYLDPFHPKRKFVGVALEKEDKLPYSHFDPTPRRFGRVILKGKEAESEHDYLSRKETLLAPEVFKSLKEREEKRNSKKETFLQNVPKFVTGLSEEEIKLAAARLVKIDGFLRGGKSLDDARFYTTYNYNYDLTLKSKRNEISEEQLELLKSQYQSLVSKIDSSIMFDARFHLTKNLTLEEIESKKKHSFEGLKSLIPDISKPVSKETKAKAIELIETPWFSLKEQLRLRRQFLKPVLPESPETLGTEKDKKVIAIQRMNVETRNVEIIYRKKNAFLN